MRPLRLVALVFAAVAVPHVCLAQLPSLADVARRAEQQRKNGQVAARVYTNRDLVATGLANTSRASDTPAAQAPAPQSLSAAASAAAVKSGAATSAPAAKSTQTPVTGSAPATGLVASSRPWGRVAFFTNTAQVTGADRESQSYTEFVTQVAIHSNDGAPNAVEYGLDTRMAGYSGMDRDPRVSIYDAWAGVKLMDGALRVRGGQMWITDLGGLGAIAGGLVE